MEWFPLKKKHFHQLESWNYIDCSIQDWIYSIEILFLRDKNAATLSKKISLSVKFVKRKH